jgi:hypothetical protein
MGKNRLSWRFFDTAPSFPAVKNAVFAACRCA